MDIRGKDEICKACGTTGENHFTFWENGVPSVGSYRDAPQGRICSPKVPTPLPANLSPCQLKYLETSHRSYCATHQRDEIECVKAELRLSKTEFDKAEQSMRILAALAIAKGGEFKIHAASVRSIGPETCLDVFQDGPLVVVKVQIHEKKAT